MARVMKNQGVTWLTSLYKPIHCHPYVVLGWNFVGISLFLSKHQNGRFGELKLLDEKVTHALSIVDATFELMP